MTKLELHPQLDPSTTPNNGTAGPQRDFSIRRAVGREQLGGFDVAWQLLDRDASPIQQFDWAAINAEYTPAKHVEALGVFEGKRLAAVVPFAEKRVAGARRLVMLGVDEHHEPMDLLADDETALNALACAIAADGRPMILGRLPGPTPTVEAIRNAFAGRGLVIERRQASYPFIPLDASWSDPDTKLNSGRRSDLRRMRRKAEAMGKVVTEIVNPMPEQVDPLLDEAFACEAKSWKGLEGTALACDPVQAAHTRRYAHAACRAGILRLCLLRIDGRVVAMQVAIQQGGGFWLLKIGYDAGFAQCSPGQMLLRDSIAYAAQAGLKTFEFLGQSEPWIEVWTDHKRDCIALRLYPYTFRGLTALAADAVVRGSIVAKDRLRRGLARLREFAKSCAMPLVKCASRCYIAGDTLDDALRVRDKLAANDKSATVGFWDHESHTPRRVADEYLAGLRRLAECGASDYLSIKLPALRFQKELSEEVAKLAGQVHRRIHFDSHGPEVADRQKAQIEALLAADPQLDVGLSIPGRWVRSLADVDWACERGLFVRVVKGQWEDPADPTRDQRAGFLEVVDRLAGRARRVAIATHDPKLAAEALERLKAKGTPCEMELLHGLPMRGCCAVAQRLDVNVRVYVPYGEAYMPYALSQARRNPRILWWLLRDGVASIAARVLRRDS